MIDLPPATWRTTQYAENTKQNTNLRQQMSAQNLIPEVVRQGTQQYILGMVQTTTNRKRNKEEKMESDRT